jgi:hypothetical protein
MLKRKIASDALYWDFCIDDIMNSKAKGVLMNEDNKFYDTCIRDALVELSKERQIFHSEADFQHAFAMYLSKVFHDQYDVRLERCIKTNNDNFYVDIFLIARLDEQPNIAIELKYKTNEVTFEDVQGEVFSLKGHSANDLGRYHFREDLFWLEQLKKDKKIELGFAIFLTNDDKYWKLPTKEVKTLDMHYRIHEVTEIPQIATWNLKLDDPTHWTKKHRELRLSKSYNCKWENYSDMSNNGKNLKFNYLLCVVN